MAAEPEPPIPLLDLNAEQGEMRSTNRRSSESNIFISTIRRYKIPIVYTLGGLLVIVLISIGTIRISKRIYSKICVTKTCNSTASFIVNSINHSVNPCENFYDFICGNSDVEQYSVFNAFESLTSLIDQIPNDGPEYMKKLKRFHQSCVDYKGINEEVRETINKIYPWPIFKKNRTNNEVDFDWINITHKLFKQGFRKHLLFDASLEVEYVKILSITNAIFNIHAYIRNMTNLKDFKETVTKSFRRIGVEGDIQNEINDITDFQSKLANIGGFKKLEYTTIGELEAKYPKLKLLDYLNGIFSPYEKFNASQRVKVESPFIDNFYNIMTDPELMNRTLANYLSWGLVRNIEEIELPESLYNDTENNRKIECTYVIYNDYMVHAASALYVQNHNIDSRIKTAMNISLVMRKMFVEIIRRNDWLTKEMKNKLEKKISNINLLVGYPTELCNDTILDNFYRDLDISSDNFIVNAISYKKFKLKLEREQLQNNNVTDWTGYFADVLETNAKYYVENSIHVPVHLIQPLLADSSVPSYMNYAFIGSIIGRVLAHSLSLQSVYFNEYGYYSSKWFNKTDLKKYMDKLRCTANKYKNYTHPVFKNLTIDGHKTLDENLSDLTGLKIAYDAYLEYMKSNPSDAGLVGLENYTPTQMFWMTFASSWCSDEKYDELLHKVRYDKHAPERFRINGALSGLKDFSQDFNCQPTDAMNPANKCPTWF